MDFNKDELSLILDGLAALPLARSYNLFQKCLAEFRVMGEQPEIPVHLGSDRPGLLNGAAANSDV